MLVISIRGEYSAHEFGAHVPVLQLWPANVLCRDGWMEVVAMFI